MALEQGDSFMTSFSFEGELSL